MGCMIIMTTVKRRDHSRSGGNACSRLTNGYHQYRIHRQLKNTIKETVAKRKLIRMYYYFYVSFITEELKVIRSPFSRNSCTTAEKELAEQAFVAVARAWPIP